MKSAREQYEGIKKLIAENKALQQIMRDVLESFARNDFSRAEKLLAREFAKHNLKVRKIDTGNINGNKNYVAYDKYDKEIFIQVEDSSSEDEAASSESDDANVPFDRKIIIQLCRKSPEGVSADNILAEAGRFEWMVDRIFFHKIKAEDFPGDNVYLTVMDYYPDTLDKMITRLSEMKDPAACIRAAVHVGQQISSILTDLTKLKLIWTDLKPGNLLLRADGQIVIADTKGIIDPTQLRKRVRDKSLIFGDVSTGFLSEDFKRSRQMKTLDPVEARAIWDREYSYQLAVTLHSLATASPPRLSEEGGKTTFDFNHPVFETESGRRLQYIISRLGDNQLLDRMHHEDAAELLSLLDEPRAFEELRDKVEIKIAAAKEASESVYKGFGIRTPDQVDKLIGAMHKIEIANARHEDAKAQEGWAVLKRLKFSLTKLRKSSKEPDISAPLSPTSEHKSMKDSSSDESPPPIQASRTEGLKPKREGKGGSGKSGSGKQRSASLSSAVQSFMTSPRKKEEPPAKGDERKSRSWKSKK